MKSKYVVYGDNEDGAYADITLSKPLKVNGTDLAKLRMREPEVRDQLAVAKSNETAEDRELDMFAKLCGLAPTDLHVLKSRDYSRLQSAYMGFID